MALRPRADGVVRQVEVQLLQTGYLAQAAGEVLAACVASARRERGTRTSPRLEANNAT